MRRLILSLAATVAVQAVASTGDTTVVQREASVTTALTSLLTVALENPVVEPLRAGSSFSHVGGAFDLRDESRAVDPRLGNHEQRYRFEAASHIHHGNSVLWGSAGYDNGSVTGMHWNETSDLDMIYPYALGDSVLSHRMKLECYRFMGGYATHRGKWSYGGRIAYAAGLYYRSVDPRPRNVTADLDLRVGVGRDVGNYMVSATVGYKRYKQTNDVAFYSEMGSDKIFHLTGFAIDYGRFGGTGYATSYRGTHWIAMLGVNSRRNTGWHANVIMSRLSLDNIITSLNKLPLAGVTQNAAHGELAWLDNAWGVKASAAVSRRVGTENVFGDAAASVYPVIGSLAMYHENRATVGASVVAKQAIGQWTLVERAGAGYDHCNAVYADPPCREWINSATANASLTATLRRTRSFTTLTTAYSLIAPVDDNLLITGTTAELAGLQRVVESVHDVNAHYHSAIDVAASHTRAINARYGVRVTAQYSHGFYHGISTNAVTAAVAMTF